MPDTPTQRLDVEDDDARQHRLRELLQRIDNSTASPILTPSSNNTHSGPSSFDFGVRETHPVHPPTQLIARLEAFLPHMEAANAEVLNRMRDDPESVDIEHIGPDEPEYVEMNLGIGVFDVRRRDPGHSRSSLSNSGSDSDTDSPDDDASNSDSGTSSDSDASASAIGGSNHRPIRPLPARAQARPQIVVLGEHSQSSPDNTERR